MNQIQSGFVDRSWVEVLELTGADRVRFLNGQITCEIKDLEPGEGTYGFFTNIKGRIQADVTVLALEDRLWLELPAQRGETIREHLEKYILADQVAVAPLEGWRARTLAGAGSAAILEELGVKAPTPLHQHRQERIGTVPVRLVRQGGLGVEAFTFWHPSAPSVPEGDAVEDTLRQAGAEALDFAALDAARIDAGIPWFGRDFGPENFPQETGLEEAISYTKGCYLGQEVVARLHYRGQVSRQLRRLRLTKPVEEGTEVLFEGRSAGMVTSVAGPPLLEEAVALSIVQRRAFEPGTRLEVAGGGEAVVAPLT